MIRQAATQYGYWIVVGALSMAIALMLGFMFVNIAVPELQQAGVIAGAVQPPPSNPPSASPDIGMGGAILPGDAECAGCHQSSGGLVGLRDIPVMGHPSEGWGKCIDCHATARLVDTAPGHSGIHATECTVCHKPGNLPAPLSRPHRENQNDACLTCHGTAKASLPADMTHRKEAVCWLCHRLPTIEPPVPAHETAVGETDCLTCHRGGGDAGKLPADHLERPADLCLSCHEVTLGSMPDASPSIVVWPVRSASPEPLATPLVPLSP